LREEIEPSSDEFKIKNKTSPFPSTSPDPGSNGGLLQHVISNQCIESRCTPSCYRVVVSVLLNLGMLRKNYGEKYTEAEVSLQLNLIFGGDIGLGVLDRSLEPN
jgi:hypothetical protein